MSTALDPTTDCPVKMGKSSRDTQGNPVLVNPQGKAFAINHILRTIWEMLDGNRTVDQLVEEIVETSDNTEGYQREDLREIVQRLYQVNLAG